MPCYIKFAPLMVWLVNIMWYLSNVKKAIAFCVNINIMLVNVVSFAGSIASVLQHMRLFSR